MRRHLLFLTALLTISSPAADVVGGTGVLRWKDGKDAVFLLAFDDSCVSHLEHAIPELEKRGLVGNFYIVPGKGALPPKKEAWQKVASSPAVALQNHTFTHAGATTVDQLDDELTRCNQAIRRLLPDRKWPRLIAFGYPGGVPWTVPRDQLLKSLEKHHLIERPRFHGPPFHQKSLDDCLATIDRALVSGDMGHLDFHGVGGDWHVTPLDWYRAILDRLVAEKERLWIADNVEYHQYLTQRESAVIKVLDLSDGIRIQLTCEADPAFYDLPLTLETRVFPDWKQCVVRQGDRTLTVPVLDGMARYPARPGKEAIHLSKP